MTFIQKTATQISTHWGKVASGLEMLKDPALLLARLYVAKVFFLSGLTKTQDWGTTVALFTDEYKIPLLSGILPPSVVAFMGTAGELVLPILLVVGLFGRFAALALFVLNLAAVYSLAEITQTALQQHVFWGALLAGLAIWGGGKWAVENLGFVKKHLDSLCAKP